MVLGSSLQVGQAAAKPKTCDSQPTGITTSDYFVEYETASMPDHLYNGRTARLRVHAVRPVYANGKCAYVPTLAAVLIHGRTTPGSATFDLRHPTAADPSAEAPSVQAAMARVGVDTFAPDQSGTAARLALPTGSTIHATAAGQTTRRATPASSR